MIVISMALIKKRLPNLKRIINSIKNQTKKVDKVIVNVSKESFFLDDGIKPKELPRFDIVEYNFVQNTGSLRKYIPVVNKYKNKPNTYIIIMDDDKLLKKNAIKKIIKCSKTYPNKAIGIRGFEINQKNKRNNIYSSDGKIKRVEVITSFFLLIKPRFVDIKTLNKWNEYEVVKKSDEVFLSYCLAKKGTERILLPTKERKIIKKCKGKNIGLKKMHSNKKAKHKQIMMWRDVLRYE